MKQKKLSDRQKKNMQSIRIEEHDKKHVLEGTVICHRGREYDLLDAEGQKYTLLENRKFYPVVGDRVQFKHNHTHDPILLNIFPRKNELQRLDQFVRKPIASNIDYACVVLAFKPVAWPEMIAQYITYLNILKISPCFIVNKMDMQAPDQEIVDRLQYLEKTIEIPVFYGSAKTGRLIEDLKSFLSNKKSIFLGPSGVGKSSIIQRMIPLSSLKVGELSLSEVGRHTTSVTQMYHLEDCDGAIIDAPGVRQSALGPLTRTELLEGFRDFQQYSCRFKNCDHIHSAGCQILPLLESNAALAQRYKDYIFLGEKFITV